MPAKKSATTRPAERRSPARADKTSAKKPLPPALAKNAARSAAMKRARLASEARADIELIKHRRQRIAEDFYDIGEALTRLKRPGVAEALGHSTFGDLCQVELGFSGAKAAQLLAIVRAIPRDQARSLGQERAVALLALAEATPEDDSAVSLASSILKLPSGKRLDIAKAPTRALRDAAKEIRQKQGSAP